MTGQTGQPTQMGQLYSYTSVPSGPRPAVPSSKV